MSPQFDFIYEYVVALLTEQGLWQNFTQDQKDIYVPQIMSHVQERLGIALLPRLSPEQIAQFTSLLEKETTPEEWKNFWYTSVPDFEEEVKNVLIEFTERTKQIFAELS